MLGRIYDDGAAGASTEVITMGVQMFYDNPVSFFKCDPDHFAFIMGILMQRL